MVSLMFLAPMITKDLTLLKIIQDVSSIPFIYMLPDSIGIMDNIICDYLAVEAVIVGISLLGKTTVRETRG